MNQLKHFSLFLNTYYSDCYEYYIQTTLNKRALMWDYICITASDNDQAYKYELEIKSRKGFLPSNTKFLIIPDYKNQRVGSGGATLSVLKELKEKYSCDFNKNRILIIHSGGDSKRIPQYSAIGKLFSPIPHVIFEDRPSTLFDELLISISYIPTKMKNGALILSGDVLLLFNNLDFYAPKEGAAAISFKESIDNGINHGVFNGEKDKPIKSFLHKQPKEVLCAIADSDKQINIDTGAVYFSSSLLDSLYSLVDNKDKFESMVNPNTRLSLYGDFLYPLASDSTLEKFYKEKPEGTFTNELKEARTLVWNKLNRFRLVLESFLPSKFVHFGTSKEVHDLNTNGIVNYSYLGWQKNTFSFFPGDNVSGYMSVVFDNATLGESVYLESSYVHSKAIIGNNTIVSHLDIIDEKIPDDVVIHGLKLLNGKFVVRIFGINDNPKENKLFGVDINNRFKELGINSVCNSLWELDLYPECDNIQDAIRESLNVYDIIAGNGDIQRWKSSKKHSLKSSFEQSDPISIFDWNKKLIEIIEMEKIYDSVRKLKPASFAKAILKRKELTKNQREWLNEKQKEIPFVDSAKIYHFIANALNDNSYIDKAYGIINSSILEGYKNIIKYNDSLRITKNETLIKMPLRVNFGGGWSDTPPYCNEHGGTVLNAGILLNDELPVSVFIQRTNDFKIVFESDDENSYGEFTDIKELQDTGNPFDEFALQKAVLIATGVIPQSGEKLENILKRIGGGFIMKSEVTNVPKGSGLGTSSILSACCVKAVFDFFGKPTNNDEISSVVICVEQIMSTGGGWQDQIGGLYPGIKMITSNPGMIQNLNVEDLKLDTATIRELNDRLVLISTGQRRLARNLLRSVLSRYLSNNEDSLYALNKIQDVAKEMKEALEVGDITHLGELLDSHWQLSKTIDGGSSNELIEQIFNSIDDLICGRMVVGAGGGGFLQVILKKGIKKEELINRIDKSFSDTNVKAYCCKLFY